MAGQRQDGAGNRMYPVGGEPVQIKSLDNVIRGLVVPRLLSSYVATAGEARVGLRRGKAPDELRDPLDAPVANESIDPNEVDALCTAVLHDDLAASRGVVERIARKGVPTSTLLAQLLAPAAMSLGDRWLGDDCSFVDVTLGLGTFQMLLRDVCGAAPISLGQGGTPLHLRSFAILPEQHTLGNLITGEMFRAAGWAVGTEQPASHAALLGEVRQTKFDVIGVSISSTEHLQGLGPLATSIKAASLNPSTLVIAGGSALTRSPTSAKKFEGVDHVVRDLEGLESLIRDLTIELDRSGSLSLAST